VAHGLLEGDALATFNHLIGETVTSHNAYKEAIEAVMASVLPRKTVLLQKLSTHHFLCKLASI